MRLRLTSSSMNSERRRIRVIGVRRSWLIAASILVRSSIRPVMRSRIRLSARATERISSGPRSGSGAAAPLRLKLSAALANDDSGAVNARAAQLHGRGKLAVAAVRRRLRLVGPLQQETRGDDQMKRCDRDDDEGCDLAADAAQVQEALHDQWPAAVTASALIGSTRGVNM